MRTLYIAVMAGFLTTGEVLAGPCDALVSSQANIPASEVIACLLFQKTQLDQLRDELIGARQSAASTQFPKGAVLAFSRDDGCPSNWSDFDEGQGRTIVGVDRSKYRLRFEGGKPVYQTGGAEAHTLRIAEMPPHEHRLQRGGADTAVNIAGLVAGTNWGVRQTIGAVTTSTVGGGKPHNNMPPYVALYWCKKD